MKKHMIKFSAVIGMLMASLFTATSANATCYVSSQQVERVISYGSYGYIYLRAASALTNTYYYYVRTTSDQILSLAANAHTDSSRVNVSGDAATCPTTGTGRYMGNAGYLYIIE